MSGETPATRLRDAAALVRADGHARRRLLDEEGRRCAVGAICGLTPAQRGPSLDHLLTADPVAKQAVAALAEVLPEVRNARLSASARVTIWNDQEARHGEEVAQTMEKAAARYEETH